MYRLRNYDSPVLASLAVGSLRQHGIAAKVVGQILEPLGPYAPTTLGPGAHCVAIAFERDRELALALLDELSAQPTSFDPGWESQAEPDLTRLDPALTIPCPGCGSDITGYLGAGRCPACGSPFDAADAVVRAHGPEALADCCAPPPSRDPRDPSWITPELLADAPLPCAACGHFLDGLPLRGCCPGCGCDYDKHDLLDDLIDRM